jgi:hypothetical protein
VVTTTKQAGRKRWAGIGDEERRELMASAAKAYWDSLTPEQRSAEMKRRAAKRKKAKS